MISRKIETEPRRGGTNFPDNVGLVSPRWGFGIIFPNLYAIYIPPLWGCVDAIMKTLSLVNTLGI
jgi:hypothetical protein